MKTLLPIKLPLDKKIQCDPRTPLRATKKQDIAFYYKKALKEMKTHDSVIKYDEKLYKNSQKQIKTPQGRVRSLHV